MQQAQDLCLQGGPEWLAIDAHAFAGDDALSCCSEKAKAWRCRGDPSANGLGVELDRHVCDDAGGNIHRCCPAKESLALDSNHMRTGTDPR